MSELSVSGKLKKVLPVESGTAKASGKEWKKQQFVVSNNEGYEGKEQIFCFEVFGEEKVENLGKYHKEGDDITVKFNISTNEWNGKYFTSLSAWRIEKAEGSATPPPVDDFQPALVDDGQGDDVPF
ncbi:hypothetical protein Nekkels1_85 [Cellulophaga phage Nekkels_1]|uniref:DUF3127 domain-containing protein n=1 Tax=Cellulophaga phage Nekkels_1 TaxID=2745692 RepID=A0A8E4UXJ8_9CAUD|nr:single strand DNA binding protein [Cellulophaga phage Nekkels_1]QQO97091.1 hypothetical protein Nekkels1_85 [Cellulophaga phage Nekkels_1]QQO97185.1 hypothetical protein Nekkels2_86 [Cellulophaga phage Nekkels_2]